MRGRRRDGENKVPTSEATLSVRNHLVPGKVINSSSEEMRDDFKRNARYLGYFAVS